MENESAEHGIRLDLSLLERGEGDILWNKKNQKESALREKGTTMQTTLKDGKGVIFFNTYGI